jgi:hypothetical protein
VTSCGSSWTVMTWSKFVYVYWRVDGVLLLERHEFARVLQTAKNISKNCHKEPQWLIQWT